MPPALLILAAGLGSRYGADGEKQLAAVGPHGEMISEYLIYDALRAGFGDIVMVIREGMQPALDTAIRRRFGNISVRYVVQRLTDLPPGADARATRRKPWGTAHAVAYAAREIRSPFGVVNADDFYGREAFECLGQFLHQPDDEHTFALIAFPLAGTLSASGGVNRGVCRVGPGGWLDRIREIQGLEPHDGAAQYRDESRALHVLPGDTPVSMNMWGFTPAAVPEFQAGFATFLAQPGSDISGEYLLPTAVEDLVRGGRARVRVLTGPFQWYGVTYPTDRAVVARAVERLVARGAYPAPLRA